MCNLSSKGRSPIFSLPFLCLSTLYFITPLEKMEIGTYLSSGCYSKYHKLGVLNNEYLFLTVLAAGHPRAKDHQVWCLVRTYLLACKWTTACYIPTWQKEREEANSPLPF